MTGHHPSFLTTLQATLDLLDDISGVMEENTYLTLTNNLQQLYNIHTSSTNIVPISIVPISIVPIDNSNITHSRTTINYDVSGVITAITRNTNTTYITNTNTNNNENNYFLNRENARMSYSSLFGNDVDYWNQPRFQRAN
jgi:hypothetical protein